MSETKRGPGRPPVDAAERLSERITFRATQDERERWEQLAGSTPLGEYIREALDRIMSDGN